MTILQNDLQTHLTSVFEAAWLRNDSLTKEDYQLAAAISLVHNDQLILAETHVRSVTVGRHQEICRNALQKSMCLGDNDGIWTTFPKEDLEHNIFGGSVRVNKKSYGGLSGTPPLIDEAMLTCVFSRVRLVGNPVEHLQKICSFEQRELNPYIVKFAELTC